MARGWHDRAASAEEGRLRRSAVAAIALGAVLAGSISVRGAPPGAGSAGGGEGEERAAEAALEADLAVTLIDTLDPIAAGRVQLYRIAVANHGPGLATGVGLQHELPLGGVFLGAEPSAIGCRPLAGRLVECDLGTIAAGAAIELWVGVWIDPRIDGRAASEALAAANEPDPDGTNDGAAAETDVAAARAMVGVSRGGGRALAMIAKEGSGAVGLVLADPAGGDREYSVELPGFRAAALTEVPSFGATPASEVASLAAGFGGETRVAIVDAGSRELLGDHEVAGDWWAIDLVAVDSFAGGAAAELALLLRDRAGGEPRLRVIDAASGRVVRDHPLAGSTPPPAAAAAPFPIGMALVPDLGGTPRPELAIVTRSPGTGEVRVLVVDVDSGAVLGSHGLGAGLFPLAIVALPDLGLAGGTPAADVGVLARRADTGGLQVQRLDAANGAPFGPIDLDGALLPGALAALPNLAASPAAELAVLGRVDPDTLILSVRDAATGAAVSSIVVGTGRRAPLALGLVALPDLGGGPAPELGVLFELPGDPTRVSVCDAAGGAPLFEFVLP